jgi:hypothetical protein
MTVQLEDSSKTIRRAIDDLVATNLIPAIDKANILMVLNGDKPSMHTGFFSDYVAIDKDLPGDYLKDRATFSKVIADLGLKCKMHIKHFEKEVNGVHSYTEWTVFCIAKELGMAIELFDARESCNEEREGILLGFPRTAVEAFVNGNMLGINEVPSSTEHVSAEAMKFLNHRLSKEHWEEEVKYLPNFARTVMRISPEIYNQCLAEAE